MLHCRDVGDLLPGFHVLADFLDAPWDLALDSEHIPLHILLLGDFPLEHFSANDGDHI